MDVVPNEMGAMEEYYHYWKVETIKAWIYSRNCANDTVIVTVFVGLCGYMYDSII